LHSRYASATVTRRRSRDVALVVVPLLAAAVTGCGGSDTAYCVDQNNDVVENRNCDGLGTPGFFWYYGAGVGAARIGTKLKGGERVVSTDIATNVRKGGFGSSSSSSGVGRSIAHSGGG
jgi:hypothetical protein